MAHSKQDIKAKIDQGWELKVYDHNVAELVKQNENPIEVPYGAATQYQEEYDKDNLHNKVDVDSDPKGKK